VRSFLEKTGMAANPTDKSMVQLDQTITSGAIRVQTARSTPLAFIRKYDGQHGDSMIADSDVKVDRDRMIIGSHNDGWF